MNTPRLSVVMPIRNCAHCVRGILDDLYMQERLYKPGLEIVAVDDASNDGSPEIVLGWARETQIPLTLIRNERRMWSYGSRLAGMARASGGFVWNVDADDRIPEHADISRALDMAEKLGCDILHCRAVGVRAPSPLHLPLPWTEPVADELKGQEVFRAFMARDYPPAILWNKFFSRELTQKIVSSAPDIEVRYFDVKFFGLLAILFAQGCHACNEVIYEYRMRGHRPAELYARQVASMLLLREHLSPIVWQKAPPEEFESFTAYCERRLAIQTGHLCIMARDELKNICCDMRRISDWLAENVYPHLEARRLFQALVYSLHANSVQIADISRSQLALYGLAAPRVREPRSGEFTHEALAAALRAPDDPQTTLRLGMLGLQIANTIENDCDLKAISGGRAGSCNHIVWLMLANAALAKIITSILAPQTDIIKKAN